MRVTLGCHAGAVYPAGDLEWAVVQQLVSVGAKAALGGIVEIFTNRQKCEEHQHLVKEWYGAL